MSSPCDPTGLAAPMAAQGPPEGAAEVAQGLRAAPANAGVTLGMLLQLLVPPRFDAGKLQLLAQNLGQLIQG